MAGRMRLLYTLVPAALLALASRTHPVEACKVKVDARDGTLLASAKAVGANPRWGFTPTTATSAFVNEATCVAAGVAKKCELGAPGSAARITPPDLCTLYVADDSGAVCAAYIKACVPGVRTAAAGPPGSTGPQGETRTARATRTRSCCKRCDRHRDRPLHFHFRLRSNAAHLGRRTRR